MTTPPPRCFTCNGEGPNWMITRPGKTSVLRCACTHHLTNVILSMQSKNRYTELVVFRDKVSEPVEQVNAKIRERLLSCLT